MWATLGAFPTPLPIKKKLQKKVWKQNEGKNFLKKKQILCQKIFDTKMGVKNSWKNCGYKKNCEKKNWGEKNIWVKKKMGVKKLLEVKKTWGVKKIKLGVKKNGDKKKLGWKKSWGLKKIGREKK